MNVSTKTFTKTYICKFYNKTWLKLLGTIYLCVLGRNYIYLITYANKTRLRYLLYFSY